jgi:hypothetical protein
MIRLLIFALLLQGAGPKKLEVAEDAKIKPPLVVPKGTAIPIALINAINTKTAKDGDSIYARTTFPIGAHVRGKITEVQRAGRVKGKAELALSFQQLVMPSGLTIELFATLGTSEAGTRKGETGIEGESSKGEDAGKIGTGAAGGALGGIIHDRSAKSAGVGAAAGGIIGVAGVLLTRGKDLVLPPGTTLEIILDRPLEP